MRVFKTVLYKQEVMHVVLVHSSFNHEQFSEFPLLTDDPNAVCVYRDGHFIWRPEAMCKTHSYTLELSPAENLMHCKTLRTSVFYLWDHVAVALHMERGQTLSFDVDRLRENLSFCEQGRPTISAAKHFDTFREAEVQVHQLWPRYRAPLRKELSLQQSWPDPPPPRKPRPAADLQTLIVGDFNINSVQFRNLSNTQTYCRPNAVVSDVTSRIRALLGRHPTVRTIVVHVGANDTRKRRKRQSEVMDQEFTLLLNTLSSLDVKVIVSGPLLLIRRGNKRFRRGNKRFRRLTRLNKWLESACDQHDVHFINNFEIFFDRRSWFGKYGLRLNKRGIKKFISNRTLRFLRRGTSDDGA